MYVVDRRQIKKREREKKGGDSRVDWWWPRSRAVAAGNVFKRRAGESWERDARSEARSMDYGGYR
jgi:hypothetical protein